MKRFLISYTDSKGISVKHGQQKPIPFMKLSGSGNDFILIDNRKRVVDPKRAAALSAKVCAHRMSVGGDGLILIEPSRRADFRWRLFNADGSEAEFSGNGARCAARFAYLKRIAPKHMQFETLAGLIEADMVASQTKRGAKPVYDQVKVRFPDPKGLRLHLHVDVNGTERDAHFIDTGVPHCVYVVPDPDTVDIVGLAGRRAIMLSFSRPAPTSISSPCGTRTRFGFERTSVASRMKPWRAGPDLSHRRSSPASSAKRNRRSHSFLKAD